MSDPWDGLEANWYPDAKGDQLLGVVETVTQEKGRFRLGIRTQSGILRWVTAWQAHLQSELADWLPREGETIWIRYEGEDERSAPGRNPSKLFTVKIDGRGGAGG